MSRKLHEMITEKYPEPSSIYLYPSEEFIERIHLILRDTSDTFSQSIVMGKSIIENSDIRNIAEKIFDDVEYEFYPETEEGTIIYFSPAVGLNKMTEYSENYRGHYIAVERLTHPVMTISTGNRGQTLLNDRQREKYFEFVNKIYEKFLKSAKKGI